METSYWGTVMQPLRAQRLLGLICFLVVGGFGARPLWAHHSMGHSAAPNTPHSYASQARPPETFLNFNTTADRLDGGLGYLWAYQLAGEYTVSRRFSMGGRLPVLSIREQFLPDTDGLGDIALSLKGLVAERLERRFALHAGTEVSFPTGSASKGTGAGNVMAAPYCTVTKGFRYGSAAIEVGSTMAIAHHPRPSIDYAVSAILPLVTHTLPVDLVLAFQGSTVTSSDTFSAGSTKAYVQPAFAFHVKPPLLATFGAKFSVIDTLALKPGITLSRQSTAPLSDVRVGAFFDIHYAF